MELDLFSKENKTYTTKKYLLVEPVLPAKAPNIALMKWARWCEDEGFEYEYCRGEVSPSINPTDIKISAVFSFYSNKYKKLINYYIKLFPSANIEVGGVFPTSVPQWFKDNWGERVSLHFGTYDLIEKKVPKFNVKITQNLTEKNKYFYPRTRLTFYASRGCVNKCEYCIVPKLEGGMRCFKSIQNTLNIAKEEMPNATGIVIYDNNFTAHSYFDTIVNELIDYGLPVEFQGLHVSTFTKHQAELFSKLSWKGQGENSTAYLRFGFDFPEYKKHIDRAIKFVSDAGVNAEIFLYLLYNWKYPPSAMWKRIVYTQEICDKYNKNLCLFPQRYEPLDALRRNEYLANGWDYHLVRGIKETLTDLRGFLPATASRNIFNWIGYSEEEFLTRMRRRSKINHTLPKKSTIPLTTKKMLSVL